MTRKIRIADLPEFDLAEHLKTDEDVAQYLTMVLEENDGAELTHALGVIARARGMTEVARASGLTREALQSTTVQLAAKIRDHCACLHGFGCKTRSKASAR